jgi:Uma2 family endonuclease
VDKPVTYARAGIPEYWIVEQAAGSFEAVIHEYGLTPTASGDAYTLVRTATLSALENKDEGGRQVSSE